jgi:hypothetical protein
MNITSVKQWLANHSLSSKTVATVWVFVVSMWYTQPAFHDYVLGIYNTLPKGLHGLIAGVVVPALIFWKSQKGITVIPGPPSAPESIPSPQKPPLK